MYKNSIKAYASRSRRGYSNTMLRGYAQGAGAVALGVAGYKLAKKLKEKINTEFKETTSHYAINNITNAGAIEYLSGIVQGDTGSTRDGSQVRCKGLSLHGRCQINFGTSNPPQQVRMIVFMQKTSYGATGPSLTDLLQSAAGVPTLGFYNLDNVPQNFRILKDKTYSLNDASRPIFTFNEHIKLNSVMRYDGGTSAYSDQASNAIHVLFVSDQASNPPDASLTVRMRYVDN